MPRTALMKHITNALSMRLKRSGAMLERCGLQEEGLTGIAKTAGGNSQTLSCSFHVHHLEE
jgi:hypothetical protein